MSKQVFAKAVPILLSLSLFILLVPLRTQAQSAEETYSFSAEAQASASNVGDLHTVDVLGSYNHSNNFGFDVGVPFHFTRQPSYFSNNTLTPLWNDAVGQPYARMRYLRTFSKTTYATMVTGYAPLGSFAKGVNTGRLVVDWYNHFDVAATSKLTPFGNVGVANGLQDGHFVTGPYAGNRPFQTLGFVSDLEGGASYAVHPRLSIGASGFEILPAGRQKLYSRLVPQGSFVTGPVTFNRYFEHQFMTAGPSDIARDDGFTGFATVGLPHSMDVQVGYTRSVHYAFNSLAVTLAINPNSFVRTLWR